MQVGCEKTDKLDRKRTTSSHRDRGKQRESQKRERERETKEREREREGAWQSQTEKVQNTDRKIDEQVDTQKDTFFTKKKENTDRDNKRLALFLT